MTAETLRRAASLMRDEAMKVCRPLARDEMVALAVADLLDVWARNDLLGSPFSLPEEVACITDLARAYLGEA